MGIDVESMDDVVINELMCPHKSGVRYIASPRYPIAADTFTTDALHLSEIGGATAIVQATRAVTLPPRRLGVISFSLVAAGSTLLAFTVGNEWTTPVVILGLAIVGLGEGTMLTLLFNVLVSGSPKELAGGVDRILDHRPEVDLLDLPYDFDSLNQAGSMSGSGAIIVLDDSADMVTAPANTGE